MMLIVLILKKSELKMNSWQCMSNMKLLTNWKKNILKWKNR